MRIVSLELENIKSYRQARVDFTSGLNAVCGMNGSGKTTLLEAIGFALFDSLPYSHGSFLREGAKTGSVRVRLLARDDREYEIVRKIGAGNPYYVSDVETGTRLAERGENVLDWVAAHALGIDGGADLPSLFKNAVGVPQGLMTADFQRTPAQRKGVFDPLLRVEEYRDAYESLRESVSYLKDRSARVREEIAGLESDTKRIPQQQGEQQEMRDCLRQIEAHLVELADALDQADRQRVQLDGIEAAIHGLQIDLGLKEQDVSGLVARLGEQEKAVRAARDARRVVGETESGYQKVTAARERLAVLEASRKERDALRDDLNGTKQTMQGIHGRIESLDAELRQARDAATAATQLVDRVGRQNDLDAQLQEARMQAQHAQRLDEQVANSRGEIADLERSCADLEVRLAEARSAGSEAGRLAEVEEQLRRIGDQLAVIEPLKTQLREVGAEGKRLRQQHDALGEEVRRRAALLAQAATQEREAADLEQLLAREQELREERARVLAAIDYQNVARADLSRRHCPLLEVPCPVVIQDVMVLDRFDARAPALTARAQQLEAELSALGPRLETAKTAAAERQTLLLHAAQLEQSESQHAEVEAALGRCRTQFQNLSRTVSGEAALRAELSSLSDQAKSLRTTAGLAAQLPLLEERLAHDRRRLASQQQSLEKVETERASLRAVEEKMQALRDELQALGDPRREQQDLLVMAQRQSELEAKLEQAQNSLVREGDRLKALTAQIQRYEGVDRESEEQRRIERDHGDDYERFLRHRDEAAQLEARERDLADTTGALDGARRAALEVRQRLEEARAGYDAEQHRVLKERCGDLGKQISAESQHHSDLSQSLKQVEADLDWLHRQEEKLRTCRAELGSLERVSQAIAFIRETIKSAGPAITETLLSNISQTANDIYAEIMDDHAAELRWDRDYEVMVQRGAETRTFPLLSGGEQMSAALAVRLALLKEMSEVDFAFFDEPTQNMDGDRRANLAGQIRAVRGFEQLIVISHDDTFEHHTDNLIRLHKIHEETEVEAG